MQIKLGTNADSWGIGFPPRPDQIPWHRFLDEVAEAGYEWIELGLYGYLPTDPKTLQAEVDQVPGGSYMVSRLEEQYDR